MRNAQVSVAVLVIAVLFTMFHAAPALAHGGHAGTTETVTPVIAGRTFAITITKPTELPAPVLIELASPHTMVEPRITILASLLDQTNMVRRPVVALMVEQQPDQYYAEAMIEQQGRWLLEVQVSDEHGTGTATIPVTIGTPPMSNKMVVFLVLIMVFAILMLTTLMSIAVRRHQLSVTLPPQ